MDNTESILTSTKKLVGVDEFDTSFDTDIITHINSTLMILNELGIGPVEGFFIEDATETWDQYLPDDRVISRAIRSFVYVKVKLVFDPPASPTVLDALKSASAEYEWRIANWASRNG